MLPERHFALPCGEQDLFAEIGFNPAPHRVRAVISLARAGHMGRDARFDPGRRREFYSIFGIDDERVFALKQVHSRRVLAASDGPAHRFSDEEADGLVTDRPQAVLAVTVADCLPIFLHDAEARVRGLVHSGWRGTGIVEDAVRMMEARYGVRRSDIRAVIGPGIGPCCYAVPRERYEAFVSAFGPSSGEERDGGYFLDLRRANLNLLAGLGIGSASVIDDCTCCRPLLGSYRRQGRDAFQNMVAMFGFF